MKSSNSAQRQSERTPREGDVDEEQKKSVRGVVAPRLVRCSSFIGLMCDDLTEFRVIPLTSISSVEWSACDPDHIHIFASGRKFTLSSDSSADLSSALGLEGRSMLACLLESVGRSEQVPPPSHLQQSAELPYLDEEICGSGYAPDDTHPPESVPQFLWRLA